MRNPCATAALLLVVMACGADRPDADTAAAVSDTTAAAAGQEGARTAASIANAMESNPAAADSILTAAGHTRESFEALMYEIAADSSLSATYAAAKTP